MSDQHDAARLLDEAEKAVTAGDLTRADDLLRQVVRAQEAALGPLHPELANTLNNLAIVAEKAGRLSDAEACYRRATAIAAAALPADHPMVVAARQNLEDFCHAQGLPVDEAVVMVPSAQDHELGLEAFAAEGAAPETAAPVEPPAPLTAGDAVMSPPADEPAASARVSPAAAASSTPRAASPPHAPRAAASPSRAPRAAASSSHAPRAEVSSSHAPRAAAPSRAPDAPAPARVPALVWVIVAAVAIAGGGLLFVRLASTPRSGVEAPAPSSSAAQAPSATPASPAPAAPSASTPPASAGRPAAPPAAADTTAASPSPASPSLAAPAGAVSRDGVTLTEAEVCRTLSTGGAVWRCDPAQDLAAPAPLVLYTRVRSPRDTAVVHRWYRGDVLRKTVTLAAKANPTEGYRTYSRQTVDEAGEWRVEVRATDGTVLHEERFTVR